MSAASKYAGYATEVGEDVGRVVVEEVAPGVWARYHCRIYRIPSQNVFRLRNCEDSTPQDRDNADRLLAQMPRGGWAAVPSSRWFRHKSRHGNFHYWQTFLGRFIDDPFAQLELEMIIDAERELTSLRP